jgi:DNA-binding MarR family transcriptional regulator
MTYQKIDRIAENIISVYPILYKSISRPLRQLSTITPGGMFVLGSLKRHGTLSMSDIGKHLSMPKPHVTVIVDKLIDESLVERQSDPNDRRIINISITEKGLKEFGEVKQTMIENLRIKLSLLSNDEQKTLEDASLKVKELLISILSRE